MVVIGSEDKEREKERERQLDCRYTTNDKEIKRVARAN